MRFVSPIRKFAHQWQSKSLYHKLGNGRKDKTYGSDAGTFLNVRRHHSSQRGIRRIVKRVHCHQQCIRDGCIHRYQPFFLNTRIIEGQHIKYHERESRPQYPGTVFSPPCLSAVGQNTHSRVYKSIDNTCHQHHGTCNCSFQTKHVRIEFGLVNHHHLKDEIRRTIAQSITDFLGHGHFLT